MLTNQALDAAQAIVDPARRARALADVAQTAAQVVDLKQNKILAGLKRAAEDAGALEQARMVTEEALDAARAITDPDDRARALAEVARNVEPSQAPPLLADALMTGHWQASVDVLVKISATAVIAIADEYLSVSASARNFQWAIAYGNPSLSRR